MTTKPTIGARFGAAGFTLTHFAGNHDAWRRDLNGVTTLVSDGDGSAPDESDTPVHLQVQHTADEDPVGNAVLVPVTLTTAQFLDAVWQEAAQEADIYDRLHELRKTLDGTTVLDMTVHHEYPGYLDLSAPWMRLPEPHTDGHQHLSIIADPNTLNGAPGEVAFSIASSEGDSIPGPTVAVEWTSDTEENARRWRAAVIGSLAPLLAGVAALTQGRTSLEAEAVMSDIEETLASEVPAAAVVPDTDGLAAAFARQGFRWGSTGGGYSAFSQEWPAVPASNAPSEQRAMRVSVSTVADDVAPTRREDLCNVALYWGDEQIRSRTMTAETFLDRGACWEEGGAAG